MTLSAARRSILGETPHAHEREAIDFVCGLLPDTDPFFAWGLIDLPDLSSGRLYEIDLLVLGYSALYLVEIKSGPGTYRGDHQDWYRRAPDDDRDRYLENPFRLANHKAKILASRLRQRLGPDAPRVEALVFLSAPGTKLDLTPEGRMHVVLRDEIDDALRHHRFHGAPPERADRKKLDSGRIRGALTQLGLRPRKARLLVGEYELGRILADGPGYQDREATHTGLSKLRTRARVFLVPDQPGDERRRQLRRAAEREVNLLRDIREHPSVLSLRDYHPAAPLGPTVLFEPFDGGVPLDVFLRKEPTLSAAARLAIVEKIGRALGSCHKRGVVHGGLSPASVLVRRRDDADGRDEAAKDDAATLELRLFNFVAGTGQDTDGTSHLTSLLGEDASVYRAPELFDDPHARTIRSDLYGLGALAYLVLTGRAPAESRDSLVARLTSRKHLDPSEVSDDLPGGVVELVRSITATSPGERGLVEIAGAIEIVDTPDLWVDALVRAFRAEQDPVPGPNPLEAQPGDVLDGGFTVVEVLGHGATSRVLRVKTPESRELALKVPLDGHEDRLRAEGAALDTLRSEHVVTKVGAPEIGGRPCLLLTLAGSETLQQRLARHGALSLEELGRYGEDLLHALFALEGADVLHRDLKPANLGIGAATKRAHRLVVFDFSLCASRPDEVEVGTAAYRDPFLRARGHWDAAADRFGAAVVLYEMATGIRPSLSAPSVDPDAQVVFAREPLDASVRTALGAFFEKAFARALADRFPDAESMRLAFVRALEPEGARKARGASGRPAGPASDATPPPVDLKTIAGDASLELLPLSSASKNALDRAGLLTVFDLLRLPENRLSVLPGVGSEVARDILEVRKRWREANPEEAPPVEPFFPGYLGDDLAVSLALTETVARPLETAGFLSLRAVASAPRDVVVRLLKRHTVAEAALRAVLAEQHQEAAERERPTSLEAFGRLFFPERKSAGKPLTDSARALRIFWGLEPPTVGELEVPAQRAATAAGVSRAAIYLEIDRAAPRWRRPRAWSALRDVVVPLVDSLGAVPLDRAAAELAAALSPERPALRIDARPDARPDPRTLALAAALVRVVAAADEDPPFTLARVHQHTWVLESELQQPILRALGKAADRLAAEPVPRALAEAKPELRAVLSTAPTRAAAARLLALSDDRLLELAAQASQTAAVSARLELYPKGLAADRALRLSAPQLRGGLSEDDLRQLVKARYPLAETLPPRPALEALVAACGFEFDEGGILVRVGERDRSSIDTRVVRGSSSGALSVSGTASPTVSRARAYRPAPDEDRLDADEIDDALRLTRERASLRVLAVSADRAAEAALALAHATGLPLVHLDALVADAMFEQIARLGISPSVVHAADRTHDRASPAWARLRDLAKRAADDVRARLLPAKAPLLLVQPGLLDRYQLDTLLLALLEAGRDPSQPAVFLLVPGISRAGAPTLGETALPGVLPSHVLRLTSTWLARHTSLSEAS